MRIQRPLFALALAVVVSACGASTADPVAPTRTVAVKHTIAYDINVPDAALAQQLQTQLPSPVLVSPIQAQTTWNFTAAYGAANVYYGPTAPPVGMYDGVGIVVAPVAVAGKATFFGFDWPGVTSGYPSTDEWQWTGRFVYTPARGR